MNLGMFKLSDRPDLIHRYLKIHHVTLLSVIVVPGPVTGLGFTTISAAILQITWGMAEIVNGEIQIYSVLVKNRAGSVFQATVPGEQMTVLVTNLSKYKQHFTISLILFTLEIIVDKYIPYNVSIKARTSAGYGPLSSNITFTEEGSKFHNVL